MSGHRRAVRVGFDCRGGAGLQSKSMYVWHDDGMSAPRKRDFENDITSFKDLAQVLQPSHAMLRSQHRIMQLCIVACGAPLCVNFSQRAMACMLCREVKPQEVPMTTHEASQASASKVEQERVSNSAAAVAGGAVSYQKAVPFQYPEQPPKQAQRPAPPKLAPLPPPPGQSSVTHPPCCFRYQEHPIKEDVKESTWPRQCSSLWHLRLKKELLCWRRGVSETGAHSAGHSST